MTRYVLAGRLGPADQFQPAIHGEEQLAYLDLVDVTNHLRFGIGKALGDLARMSVFPSEVGIDLLILAAHVHAADTRLNREQASQDAWTREIRIIVPVSEGAVWEAAKPVLEQMLRFLTGDLWQVGFRNRPAALAALAPIRLPNLDAHAFDNVALFSGGLDSLVGAIDILSEGNRPLFISHAGEGAVSKPQRDLFERVVQHFDPPNEPDKAIRRIRMAMRFRHGLFGPQIGGENSTRGRSFLFIALGAVAGSGLGMPFTLQIPENGLIALNVPLDPTRPGSNSTHTTHPFYLHRWDEVLQLIGIPGRTENRYWAKTKGEMIEECRDPEFLRSVVTLSMSCAHPSTQRYRQGGAAHCGTCVPCLIRRGSIEAAWGRGHDRTGYACEDLTAEPLPSWRADGVQVRAFQYAASRLQARPDVSRFLIHKPGPLVEDQDKLDDLAAVYRRGIAEVARLLEGVRTVPPGVH